MFGRIPTCSLRGEACWASPIAQKVALVVAAVATVVVALPCPAATATTIDLAERTEPVEIRNIPSGGPNGTTLTITPDFDFGSATVGGAAVRRVATIRNTGSASVEYMRVIVSGSDERDFKVTNNGCSKTLDPQSSCSVEIEFGPIATGSRSSTLMVTPAAPNKPLRSRLSGTGLAAVNRTSPTGATAKAATPRSAVPESSSSTTMVIVIALLALAVLLIVGVAIYVLRRAPRVRISVLPDRVSHLIATDRPLVAVSIWFDPAAGSVQWVERRK